MFKNSLSVAFALFGVFFGYKFGSAALAKAKLRPQTTTTTPTTGTATSA